MSRVILKYISLNNVAFMCAQLPLHYFWQWTHGFENDKFIREAFIRKFGKSNLLPNRGEGYEIIYVFSLWLKTFIAITLSFVGGGRPQIHQETTRISWSSGRLKKSTVPHQEKISLSPGEWIDQETKKISWSPSGLQKSVVPDQEKIS